MLVVVPKPVKELAEIFRKNKEKLYLVGGYIRNQRLGVPEDQNLDIDVCSSAKPDKVIKMLSGTKFSANYMNEELGVIEIIGGLRVEHATFRKEKYHFSGVHLPENVEFIDDINQDALRRDFRCNAVYYDILEEEIVDPLDGMEDIKKRIIRTTMSPKEVFYGDGERILRMVRFACTLGFDIDDETYQEAKKNVEKLKNVSSTRKREEFSEIVLADTKYPFLPDIRFAHARGINMLADLGALKYILPALDWIKDSNIIEDRGKFLYEHVVNVFAMSSPNVRLSALLHDVGKAKALLEYGNFHGNEEYAPVIIENNLGMNGLCFPKAVVERVKKVVSCVDFNKHGLETRKNIRHFIAENHDVVDLVIELKNAIALDKSGHRSASFSAGMLKRVWARMKQDHTPLTLAELNIKGDKLIETFPELKVNRTGALLNRLLYKCIDNPGLNQEQKLLAEAEKLLKKPRNEYVR